MPFSNLHATTTLAAVFLAAVLLAGCAGIQPVGAVRPYYEQTPSADAMRRARSAYRAGMYMRALNHYREAAVWADKFAQYNVGVMHLRGEGTEFDPVRAWAWIKLAAERDYPEFVETAEDLHTMLDEEQRRKAREIYENELLPEYGDASQVARTARKMRFGLRQATGSRTGSAGFLAKLRIYELHEGDGLSRRGDEYYDPKKWDFRQIVQFESDIMINFDRGSVKLGEFRLVDDEDEGGETNDDREQ